MITLSYAGESVSLPNPSLGDSESFNPNKVVKLNRSLDSLVAYPSNRASFYGYKWSFSALTDVEKSGLTTFLEDYAGKEILVTDHHGNYIDAVIPDPSIAFIEARSNDHGFTLQLMSNAAPYDELDYLLLEDGTYLLLENDERIRLE
jgi:hypothetical protein